MFSLLPDAGQVRLMSVYVGLMSVYVGLCRLVAITLGWSQRAPWSRSGIAPGLVQDSRSVTVSGDYDP